MALMRSCLLRGGGVKRYCLKDFLAEMGRNAISIIKYGECDSKGYLWRIRKIKFLNLSL